MNYYFKRSDIEGNPNLMQHQYEVGLYIPLYGVNHNIQAEEDVILRVWMIPDDNIAQDLMYSPFYSIS